MEQAAAKRILTDLLTNFEKYPNDRRVESRVTLSLADCYHFGEEFTNQFELWYRRIIEKRDYQKPKE